MRISPHDGMISKHDLQHKFPEGKDFPHAVCRRENEAFGSDAFGNMSSVMRGDYERQVDYLHYNPVKHGQVTRVADWPYSSFHRQVERGIYPLEGAAADNVRSLEME